MNLNPNVIESSGIYLMDDGKELYLFVGKLGD